MALKHKVEDTDNNFSINEVTRAIKNESVNKNLLVQYDHNSERFSFEIKKVIEGHEMENCKIEVHFVNIDAKTQQQSRGIYTVEDAEVSDQDSSMLVFSWLISQAATKYVGSLNFLVRFTCTGDDGELLYVWNTAVFSGIAISSGLHNPEVLPENYIDALEQWKAECNAFRFMELEQTKESTESGGENIWTATFEDMPQKHFIVRNGIDGKDGKDGIDGEKGDAGASAYKMLYDAGLFTGTEEEFMERLMCPEFYDGAARLKKVKFQLSGSVLNITTE